MSLDTRSILFPKLFPPVKVSAPAPQYTFFGNTEPLARSNGPVTSRVAAKVYTASGGRENAKKLLLKFMQYGNHSSVRELTAHEISRDSGILHSTVHKRLPDLRRDSLIVNGPVRTCQVTGRPSLTWRLK